MIELVERPEEAIWDERRLWLAEREKEAAAKGAGRPSEQGTALMVELQRSFCAGAWAAVVILAGAIVDAQSLYAGFPGSWRVADRAGLRGLRNRLLHEDRSKPALTIEDLWTKSREWERLARQAAELALDALYLKTPDHRQAARDESE